MVLARDVFLKGKVSVRDVSVQGTVGRLVARDVDLLRSWC
jgi:hypothetical protein